MSLIDHIDGDTSPRKIYLDASTVGQEIHPIDLYKEMRELRRTNESLRNYDIFMSAFGNVSKGGGKFTERYVRLNNARIVPFDTDQTITITGTIITDDGKEGVLCFDTSPLSVGTSVNINYVPPQVEVIKIATGSALTVDESTQLKEIWNILGLDSSDTMKIGNGKYLSNLIDITVTDNNDGTYTLSRQ